MNIEEKNKLFESLSEKFKQEGFSDNFINTVVSDIKNFVDLVESKIDNIVKNNETIQPDGSCMAQYKQTDRLNTARRKFQLITNPIPVSGSDRYVLLFRLKFIRPNTVNTNHFYKQRISNCD